MGLVVALVALQAGHGVLMRLGEDPNAAQRIAWTEGDSRVLLGNSVTASSLDPALLDAGLYTAEGSQPAHWWAAARHRVADGAQVILYTAPQSWGGTTLPHLRDELLLADILVREDPQLTERVLGRAMSPQALERAQARRRAGGGADGDHQSSSPGGASNSATSGAPSVALDLVLDWYN